MFCHVLKQLLFEPNKAFFCAINYKPRRKHTGTRKKHSNEMKISFYLSFEIHTKKYTVLCAMFLNFFFDFSCNQE